MNRKFLLDKLITLFINNQFENEEYNNLFIYITLQKYSLNTNLQRYFY
jgi:hypothetical protein